MMMKKKKQQQQQNTDTQSKAKCMDSEFNTIFTINGIGFAGVFFSLFFLHFGFVSVQYKMLCFSFVLLLLLLFVEHRTHQVQSKCRTSARLHIHKTPSHEKLLTKSDIFCFYFIVCFVLFVVV